MARESNAPNVLFQALSGSEDVEQEKPLQTEDTDALLKSDNDEFKDRDAARPLASTAKTVPASGKVLEFSVLNLPFRECPESNSHFKSATQIWSFLIRTPCQEISCDLEFCTPNLLSRLFFLFEFTVAVPFSHSNLFSKTHTVYRLKLLHLDVFGDLRWVPVKSKALQASSARSICAAVSPQKWCSA